MQLLTKPTRTTQSYLLRLKKGSLFLGTAISTILGIAYGRSAYAAGTCDPPGPNTTISDETTGISITCNANITEGVLAKIDNAANAQPLEITIAEDIEVTAPDDGAYDARPSGINARHTGEGNIEITTEAGSKVSGQQYGVRAFQEGDGGLTINIGGDVFQPVPGRSSDSRMYRSAVRARITEASNDSQLSITTSAESTVTGEEYGVSARHEGSGSIEIEVNGVIDADFRGIAAITVPGGSGNLAITTGASSNISGGVIGIQADHDATGDLAIDIGGTVTSTGTTPNGFEKSGIYSRSFDSGNQNIVIRDTANVFGPDHGVFARVRDQAADINMQIMGSISSDKTGVRAQIDEGGDINIETSASSTISGGQRGIYAKHAGEGSLEITVGGSVVGGSGAAMDTQSDDASTTQLIEITTSGNVTAGSSGLAIQADADNGGSVELNNYGTITGRLNLSNSNVFTNSGTWNTAGLTSDFNASGNSLIVNQGLIVAATSVADEITTLSNLDRLRNSLGGAIRLADGRASDRFVIEGNFEANGGVIELDVALGGDNSAADVLEITGDVTLSDAPTGLVISPIAGSQGAQTEGGILVVDVGGESDAGAFVLANAAALEVGAFVYNLSLGTCDGGDNSNWYLCSTEHTQSPRGRDLFEIRYVGFPSGHRCNA